MPATLPVVVYDWGAWQGVWSHLSGGSKLHPLQIHLQREAVASHSLHPLPLMFMSVVYERERLSQMCEVKGMLRFT